MKILLVDDEQQVLRGVSRIIGCEEDEWEVETSMSGEEALEKLEEAMYDVVISDMRMQGMDGAQLLEEVGKRFPKILRVVLSGQADRETVLRAIKPMHQYLAKPCEPDKLIEVIKRAEIFQETISSAETLDAIGRANCLPTFPEIVNDINQEVESENGTAKSISDIVSRDPVLCARILQLSNSSIFSLRNPVSGVEQAISVVGVDMIRSLAISQALYGESQSHDSVLSARELFDHGFTVAVIAKALAKKEKASLEDGNLVFSGGLLHDVGKLILLNAFPDKYKKVLQRCKQEGRDICELEMETFGATHQGIGGYLFGIWGLPAGVIESVASHHSFAACSRDEQSPRQLVFAANWIARAKSDEALQELVENSSDQESAQRFADQITGWKTWMAEKEEDGE